MNTVTDPDHADDAAPSGSVILRAIRILEALTAHERPPQLAEIAAAVDLPKPTVLRILATLEQVGWVAREPDTKRYGFAHRLNAFATEVLRASPARAARHAILEELVEQLGETCNLTVPNGNEVLYLDRVETGWPLRVHFGSGSRVPLYASASGKLFLSALPKAARDRFLQHTPRIRHTPQTLIETRQLLQEFEAIRERGYSVDREEYLPGICCIAVPVTDAEGRVVAGVAVQAPAMRMPIEEALEFLPALRQAADAITATLEI